MTSASIYIINLKSEQVALDIDLGKGRAPIRRTLAPTGDINGDDQLDVGGLATLDELNRNAQMRALIDHLDTAGAADPIVRLSVTRGTSDLPGAIDSVADADGLGGVITIVEAIPVGGGAAEDITLIAAMPFAANIVDAQVLVSTAEATTWTLRDALAGGGNALSDDLSVAATGRVRDAGSDLAGVMPSIARGAPLVLRKAASATAVGTIIVRMQRLS